MTLLRNKAAFGFASIAVGILIAFQISKETNFSFGIITSANLGPSVETSSLGKTDNSISTNLDRAKRKHMVVYSPYMRRLRKQITKINMTSCVINNCDLYVMTSETENQINADVIIFQGNRVPSYVPRRADADQLYVFSDTEPPQYAHNNKAINLVRGRSEFYNWTVSYRSDSDIWMPYGFVIPRQNNKLEFLRNIQQGIINPIFKPGLDKTEVLKRLPPVKRDYDEIFNKKNKNILWLVSHCRTNSRRGQYVKRMKNSTEIDIYGACGNSRIKTNDTFQKDYKFYLAFENSLCKDYITEKFFSWYSKDIIVVVRGGADYSKLVPKGTYINAADFSSPETLADFLNKLGSDREMYISYLKRKDQYQVITEQESVQNAFCTLCWRLHNMDKYRKSHKKLSKWWFDNCQEIDDI